MSQDETKNTQGGLFFAGFFICIGLFGLGYFLREAALDFKATERFVTVKGLAEKEMPADQVIWPIAFKEIGNDSTALYQLAEEKKQTVISFLNQSGFSHEEIWVSPPQVTDRKAYEYSGGNDIETRYVIKQTVTVRSGKIDLVIATMNRLSELGKKGVTFSPDGGYTEFIFTKLNDIKPEMVEEATRNARAVAEKFAEDSGSRLGKIKNAQQGQFSIFNRNSQTPQVKKIRVVSTIQYYLAD